jgi:hypothetical protein
MTQRINKQQVAESEESALVIYKYTRKRIEYVTPNESIAGLRSDTGTYTEVKYTLDSAATAN